MPTPHDDLLTPTEHEAAQLLVTLAWRLDGGQLVSADQMLARLCAIPTNDVAMASIVVLRQVAHSVAPVVQRPPIEILEHLRAWLAGRAGRPASAARFRKPRLVPGAVLPAFTLARRAELQRRTLLELQDASLTCGWESSEAWTTNRFGFDEQGLFRPHRARRAPGPASASPRRSPARRRTP
jgi:hypothetical protein